VDAFVQSGLPHAKLDHLQLIELNSVRPLLPNTLDHLRHFEKAADEQARKAANSQNATDRSLNASSF